MSGLETACWHDPEKLLLILTHKTNTQSSALASELTSTCITEVAA